ncbi:SusD/RagB family nutrient-binding outer membrane lipoprotein [Sphingobacterium multivorum]|uniref:SusD/RagB family nutrient-binding outer membrane lipoprotein n=2 Tax=Sphingobacteriaceae TaxID=84566 RepID=UPI00289BECDC|nr:SusD/RagB family nutrient-binding outer membrane lipoprotein [Sphingobacterium multivorum]
MTRCHGITLGTAAIKKENFQWDIILNMSQNLAFFHKLDPVYSADALYVKKGILDELEKADQLFASGAKFAGDPLYGGDLTKWRKLVNRLPKMENQPRIQFKCG